jgi:hypothetical protein
VTFVHRLSAGLSRWPGHRLTQRLLSIACGYRVVRMGSAVGCWSKVTSAVTFLQSRLQANPSCEGRLAQRLLNSACGSRLQPVAVHTGVT